MDGVARAENCEMFGIGRGARTARRARKTATSEIYRLTLALVLLGAVVLILIAGGL